MLDNFLIECEDHMNKAEFIDAVASSADLSKADATKAVDAMIDTVTESLRKGDSVTLVGFGTFEVRERAARAGRVPEFEDGFRGRVALDVWQVRQAV